MIDTVRYRSKIHLSGDMCMRFLNVIADIPIKSPVHEHNNTYFSVSNIYDILFRFVIYVLRLVEGESPSTRTQLVSYFHVFIFLY